MTHRAALALWYTQMAAVAVVTLLLFTGSLSAQSVPVKGEAYVSLLTQRLDAQDKLLEVLKDRCRLLEQRVRAADVYADLGCVMVARDPATYSPETATENTRKINQWLDGLIYASPESRELSIPFGYVAINGTLGRLTAANNDSVRSWPANVALLSTGGGWAFGHVQVNNHYNVGSAGLMWVGDAKTPMIALNEYGARIRCNFVGYPFVLPQHGVPRAARCSSAIYMRNLNLGPPGGKHTIEGTFTGFESVFKIETNDKRAGMDTIHVPYAVCRDSLSFWDCNNHQMTICEFGMIQWYTPAAEQSTIVRATAGGNWHFNFLGITGEYGTTVLETTHSSESGSYYFDSVMIDRRLPMQTKQGHGYLRLIEAKAGRSLDVRMRGSVGWPNEDRNTNWCNLASDESLVKLAPLKSPPYERKIKLDFWGIDHATAAAYPWEGE